MVVSFPLIAEILVLPFFISIHFRIHIMIEFYKTSVLNLQHLVFWYKGKIKGNEVQILILYIDFYSLERIGYTTLVTLNKLGASLPRFF
jgi:hypothetical protein